MSTPLQLLRARGGVPRMGVKMWDSRGNLLGSGGYGRMCFTRGDTNK